MAVHDETGSRFTGRRDEGLLWRGLAMVQSGAAPQSSLPIDLPAYQRPLRIKLLAEEAQLAPRPTGARTVGDPSVHRNSDIAAVAGISGGTIPRATRVPNQKARTAPAAPATYAARRARRIGFRTVTPTPYCRPPVAAATDMAGAAHTESRARTPDGSRHAPGTGTDFRRLSSPGWTRTNNPSVNSPPLPHHAT